MITNKEKANQIVTQWFLSEGRGVHTSDTISDYYGLMDAIEAELDLRDDEILTSITEIRALLNQYYKDSHK